MGIILSCIKNSRFTIFFTILAAILGLYCYFILPKQESPDLTAPLAVITTVYPGASPEDVERLVTSPIEEDLLRLKSYDYSESYSRNSVSIVVLYLKNNADVADSWANLARQMQAMQSRLPVETLPIQVNKNLAETAGVILSISGDSLEEAELQKVARQLKNELVQVDGVDRFEILGENQQELLVKVDPLRLAASSLSFEELCNILKAQNLEIPSGSIKADDKLINVRVPGSLRSITDIKNLLLGVSPQTGIPLRLQDLAEVSWSALENNPRIRHQGNSATLLVGYFQEDKNVLQTGNALRKKLEHFKQSAPPKLIIDEVLYQPADVSRSISTFIRDLLIGILLVIIVVLLGMGLRNALIASTAIPLSILLTFIVMLPLGIKVHEISIAALIMALGILVDDAIVMTDAIQVQLDQGLDRIEASLQGLRQAAVPIFTSTLTTIAAFAPLLFVPGPAGEFLKAVPQVVIIALIASFVVAMLLTPTLAFLFFKKSIRNRDRSYLRNFFVGFLNLSMKRKWSSLLVTFLVFLLSLYGISFLNLEFFPLADKDIIYIDINSPPTSTIHKTEEITDQVEALLDQQDEVLSYTSSIGSGLPKFYITLPASPESAEIAQVMMRVDPDRAGRFNNNEELADHLQKLFDRENIEGQLTVNLLQKAYPGRPLQIRIRGDDRARLVEMAGLIKEKLINIEGSLNVADDMEPQVNEYLVEVQPAQAALTGISTYDVQRQVNLALTGSQASTFRKNGEEFAITVRGKIDSVADLKVLPIKSSRSGNIIQLQQIADIKLQPTLAAIKKHNTKLAVTVSSAVKPGYNAVSIENVLQQKLKSVDTKGAELIYEGEKSRITDNFGNLGKAAVLALIIIYLILMLQFKSFGQPLVIFITIPLSLIGSIAGLLIFRQAMSFTALLGIVSLIGLVVRNAILLIEFINAARRAGMSVEAACKDAVERRFRPIILTAITAIMGLLDLALSRNPLFVPMAIALMSGLLVATVLTMVIVPVIYSLIAGRTGSCSS